jgi:predicted anti-sigma-YlaC factor YlaD
MDCDEAHTLISADLDGQLDDRGPLDAHLATCASCREWRSRAGALANATRASSPATHPVPRGFLAYRWARYALAWAGLLLVVWNLPGVFGTVDESFQHLWRHQHAFGVALGLTFLFVAWRPDRAYGLVPVAATFTVALGGAAVVDLVNGSTPLSREVRHIVEIAGLALLWALGVSAGPGRRRSGPATDETSVG